jgi:hypothetical protein
MGWWNSKDTEYFFELHILVDELTKDVSLMVVDFADKDEGWGNIGGKSNLDLNI